MFTRADWTLFRNLNTISQKAGAIGGSFPPERHRRLQGNG